MGKPRMIGLRTTCSVKACRDIWPRKMKKQRPRETVTRKPVAVPVVKKEAPADGV